MNLGQKLLKFHWRFGQHYITELINEFKEIREEKKE